MEITYRPIGVVHSPFTEPRGTPIQPGAARDVAGTVEVFAEFAGGLRDLGGFSHIHLLYHFHLCREPSLEVKPFMDDRTHGVFSTRAPNRPNPVGLSVVRLVEVDRNFLKILDVDILDGTPLLDIKPYVPGIDVREGERTGWLEENIRRLPNSRDDGRFTD